MYKIIMFVLFAISLSFSNNLNNKGQTMLDVKEKSIIPIAAFSANGDIKDLKVSLIEGLNSGLSINQIKEILVQVYAYAGFPRSLNALNTFMEVLNERKQKGIEDIEGKQATPIKKDVDVLEEGTKIQTVLVGKPVAGPLFDFSPQIDKYLKTHLFGDIFLNDILTYKEREIATISMLSNIKGAESQLKSHISVGMNVGLSKEQINNIIEIINDKVSKERAEVVNIKFKQILNNN